MRVLAGALRRMIADRRAATAVEYGLIVALIVLAIIASLVALGETTIGIWDNVSTKVQGAGP